MHLLNLDTLNLDYLNYARCISIQLFHKTNAWRRWARTNSRDWCIMQQYALCALWDVFASALEPGEPGLQGSLDC